jgi:integrase/transcriptional regulator with XRE-family HTH domain
MTYDTIRYPKRQNSEIFDESGQQQLLYSFSYKVDQTSPWSSVGTLWALPPTNLGASHLDTTYAQLQELHRKRLTDEKIELSVQVLKNHLSTLNSYLAFCGKSVQNRIGLEFTSNFKTQAQRFVSAVCTHKKTAADKMSILRAWKLSVDQLVKAVHRNPDTGESAFHQELRAAFARKGESIKAMAKNTGTSESALGSWLRGGFPVKGMTTLHRLEAYLGLNRGHLESLLPHPRKEKRVAESAPDAYILRQSDYVKRKFYLRAKEFTPGWIEEWKEYLKYKTVQFPVGMNRHRNGIWRVLPLDKVLPHTQKNLLCHPMPGHACPTAERVLTSIRGYFGFLALEKSDDPLFSGQGIPKEDVQTLAMCLIPEFVNEYLEFVKRRSGNILHTGHHVFAAMIASLVRLNEGYLYQRPDLASKVERYARGRSWEDLCQQTGQLCDAWMLASKGKHSRQPDVPLKNLLRLKDPLEPFQRAINKLDIAAASAPPGGMFQATYKRDAFLLAFTIANPLRARTLSITKYIHQDRLSALPSNLYKTEAGKWRLRYFQGDFKNDDSKEVLYDVPLADGLTRRLEEYIEEFRPVLISNNTTCPWLFPNKDGEMHKDLANLIEKVARNYIPEVTRMRLHALRHIAASVFLMRNPGQYALVAELLHDKLETVLKHYAHGKLEHAFQAYEEHLGNFFSD